MANAFQEIAPKSAASKSSSKKPCYEVFINHHGKDVKHKIASCIYNMLDLMGVQVFLDKDELKVGDFFPPAIEEAMRSASVHIAIFSPNYAESPWCLDELSLMLEINVEIIPVFYGVDPSDVRYVKGKYADAIDKHRSKGRYSIKKIEEWKEALSRVSYLNGCVLDADKDEGKLLREIVESALHKRKKVSVHVAAFSVGLDEAVQEFESTVGFSTGSENVYIAGIFGMGGSGKTTLAKEWFNRKRSSISRSSFLSNVRDTSKKTLHSLQKNLLTDLDIQHPEFHTVDEGKPILTRGLKSMTVLIVLDDVDGDYQLDALLPTKDNLGPGSFIVVTTWDLYILTTWGISSNYPMKMLNLFNARQLFCKHAFQPGFELLDENYHNFQDLIERFVEACKGLPLSLKVLGEMLKGKRKSYWESQLRKLSRILPGEIAECLKLSYEALDPEDQHMFLDTACFLLGEEKSLVITIWNGSGWSGEVGLETLVNKCLVAINDTDCIEMHDHLRDLGRKIAEDSLPSRIWKEEQISNQGGSTQIRGIVAYGIRGFWSTLEHCKEKIRPSLSTLQLLAVRGNDFREQLAALSEDLVWLRVNGFHRTNLSSWVPLRKLRVLELYGTTNLKEFWQDNAQLPLQLRVLIFRIDWGTRFPGLPRSIGYLRYLKKIVLNGDYRGSGMRSLPEEFCLLESLEFLELTDFPMLSSLPDNFGKLINLRWLALKAVNLTALPDSFGNLTNLQTLELGENQLTALPDSFGNLTNLQTLKLGRNQLVLSDSFGNLLNLQTLELAENRLTTLPDSFGKLTNLQILKLGINRLTALPNSFGYLTNFQTLKLGTNWLTALPDSFGNLKNLQILESGSNRLTALPDSFGSLTNLQTLDLWGNRLTALPDSFGNLTNLQTLDLWDNRLTTLPDSFGNLTNLQTIDLWGSQLSALRDSFGNLTNLQMYLGYLAT